MTEKRRKLEQVAENPVALLQDRIARANELRLQFTARVRHSDEAAAFGPLFGKLEQIRNEAQGLLNKRDQDPKGTGIEAVVEVSRRLGEFIDVAEASEPVVSVEGTPVSEIGKITRGFKPPENDNKPR